MTIKPYQLALISIGTFAAIVVTNIVIQWRGNENFRKQWEAVPMPVLNRFRKTVTAQENLMPVPQEEVDETTEGA